MVEMRESGRHIKVRAAESGEESNPSPSLKDEILAEMGAK